MIGFGGTSRIDSFSCTIADESLIALALRVVRGGRPISGPLVSPCSTTGPNHRLSATYPATRSWAVRARWSIGDYRHLQNRSKGEVEVGWETYFHSGVTFDRSKLPPICGGGGTAHWHVGSVGGQANGGRCRRHRGGAGGDGLPGVAPEPVPIGRSSSNRSDVVCLIFTS